MDRESGEALPEPEVSVDDRIERAARHMFEKRRGKRDLVWLPEDLRPRDLSEAYAVQDRLLERYLALGEGPLAGWKIALTTPVMQRMVGVDHPCEGGILAARLYRRAATVAHAECVSLGVESEIALSLDRDLGVDGAPYDHRSVADAVAGAMAAIEIVDTRNADFAAMDAALLIADNAMNFGAVVGAPVADWRRQDLARVVGRMVINGAEVGRGVGADAFGHPLAALAWLANSLVRRGRMLRAGDVVLTGSLVTTKWLKPGDEMATVIDGLGEASLKVR